MLLLVLFIQSEGVDKFHWRSATLESGHDNIFSDWQSMAHAAETHTTKKLTFRRQSQQVSRLCVEELCRIDASMGAYICT